MVNQSATRMKIETSIKNELDIDFDLDLSTSCKMAADTSQLMEGITVSGSKDVTIKQVNDLQSMCYATQVVDLDVFSQLSAEAQNDVMSTLSQEGGLPGANMSDTNIDIMNEIENNVSLEAKLKATKDCMSTVSAPQTMSAIDIQDSLNINLSQESASFNKCVFDSAVEIAQKNGIELETANKATSDVTQKAWDPIASIGGLVGSTALLALAPIISSCMVVVMVSVLGGGAVAASGGPEQGIPPPPNGIPGQAGGAISKFIGVRSRKGKRLITLLIKLCLVVCVAWILYKLFTRKSSTSSIGYSRENFHDTTGHQGYQTRPLALRHQYHHPHISEDVYPSYRTHPGVISQSHVPEYVKRWY